MNVRMRSMSVLPVVLPFFLVAALTHSLSFATVAQNRAQKESASFKNVEETVSKLLSVPVYTASDEKLLNEAGDGEITHEVNVVAVRACEGGDVLIGEALKRWIENKYGVFGVTLVPRDIVSSSALNAVGAHDVEVNCVRQRLTGLRGRGTKKTHVGPCSSTVESVHK